MVAWRRRGAFCKGVVSTAAAGAGLVVAFGVAESPQGDGWHAYPATANSAEINFYLLFITEK